MDYNLDDSKYRHKYVKYTITQQGRVTLDKSWSWLELQESRGKL